MIPHALTTEWPRETMGAGPVPEQKKAAPQQRRDKGEIHLYNIHTVDGCELLHQLIGGISMYIPLLSLMWVKQ